MRPEKAPNQQMLCTALVARDLRRWAAEGGPSHRMRSAHIFIQLVEICTSMPINSDRADAQAARSTSKALFA